ncbi:MULTISPECIES: hypothetical protein [unclassified Sphingobacterium]|uniref:hypothetical protein n=1 Tax=unclassified Sphingobacterium TaxID=2609468 RepID=UPI0025DD90EE|nr:MULTISPECIES: hypothetical protein [unclassified Sphingobacterium]
MNLARKIFIALQFVLITNFCYAQFGTLPKQDIRKRIYGMIKGHWGFNKAIYVKNACNINPDPVRDRLSLPLNKKITDKFSGIADVLIFTNEKVKIDSIKIVNLEIRNKNNGLRIYDWVYFTDAKTISELDIHKNIGITLNNLAPLKIDKTIKDISCSLLEKINECILLKSSLDIEKYSEPMIIYYPFSF